jgi:hypothetical protein
LLAIALVSAGSYYALATINLNINQPISIDGSLSQSVDCDADSTCTGEEITISNSGDTDKSIIVSSDSSEDITTSFISSLVLSKKVVDFGNTRWEQTDDKVQVDFTIVGDEFSASVTEPIEGYALIYYKDNSDRFNNPATAISIDDVEGNLPYANDGNAEEYDMCEIEGYSNCHGAKIWYVPTNAIDDGQIDWSRASEFYFETNLIQFNSEGELVVYPNSDLTFRPQFEVDKYASGSEVVEITLK